MFPSSLELGARGLPPQPDFLNEDYRLAKLFDTVKDFVLASGGDGEGWIVSPRYRELAGKFVDEWFSERWEYDDRICFAHEQEVIVFADWYIPNIDQWTEIVVKIP